MRQIIQHFHRNNNVYSAVQVKKIQVTFLTKLNFLYVLIQDKKLHLSNKKLQKVNSLFLRLHFLSDFTRNPVQSKKFLYVSLRVQLNL